MAINPKLQASNSQKKPDVRYLYDMKEVIFDKEWLSKAPNLELYYMYRGIKKKGKLRYDITIIPAKMLGKEFVKTKGHEHIGKYQEVYIVLEGEAIYLMQKRKNDSIEDIYAVKARKGDVIIIPSFYGHVTINPSKSKDLKMANWISESCQSDYQPFLDKGGAAYFYTVEGWIKNKNYKNIPKLRFANPLKSLPENLDFLLEG